MGLFFVYFLIKNLSSLMIFFLHLVSPIMHIALEFLTDMIKEISGAIVILLPRLDLFLTRKWRFMPLRNGL